MRKVKLFKDKLSSKRRKLVDNTWAKPINQLLNSDNTKETRHILNYLERINSSK